MTTFAATLIVQPRNVRRDTLETLNVYRRLVDAGHSPFKAGRIVLDCIRGDRYALQWVDALISPPASTADRRRG